MTRSDNRKTSIERNSWHFTSSMPWNSTSASRLRFRIRGKSNVCSQKKLQKEDPVISSFRFILHQTERTRRKHSFCNSLTVRKWHGPWQLQGSHPKNAGTFRFRHLRFQCENHSILERKPSLVQHAVFSKDLGKTQLKNPLIASSSNQKTAHNRK